MALADFSDFNAARARAQKAFLAPIGLASPLWFAFGAAASAGVAWWWMTRWTRPLTDLPVNLEAQLALPAIEGALPAEDPAEAGAAPVEPVDSVSEVDDLTLLTGIGPKIAQALADRGVTTFSQLAAWTEGDVARIDSELKLMGRVARDAWIAQAKRLSAA